MTHPTPSLREQLRNPDTAEFAAQTLAESNYALLLTAAREDRALMDGLCFADIIEAVTGRRDLDPEGAKSALLTALRDAEGLVQEYALKGLMCYAITGDAEVSAFLRELDIASLDRHVRPTARNLLNRPE